MFKLSTPQGEVCATVEVVPLGSLVAALRHTWSDGVAGVPESGAWRAALAELVAGCRARGVRRIEARIVLEEPGASDAATRAERTAAHRAIYASMGFRAGRSRVEYIVPLADAIAALHSPATPERLAWRTVSNEPGPELGQAAELMRACGEGDPDIDMDDDTLGFLLARREDRTLVLGPESLLTGSLAGVDAAIVASSVRPSTGWCSLYYMGVLPAYRGRRLGHEVMLRGLRALQAMGGRTYHDGTGSGNEPALSLFRRIAGHPTRVLEQWRLEG